MKKITTWIKGILYWLKKPYLLWFTIIVIVGAIIQVFYIYSSEVSFRITGLILQLFGISTVVYGIHETRKSFEHPSYMSLAKNWFKCFPKFGGRTISCSANIQGVAMVGNARGHTWMNAKDESNEERIKALEINLESVNKRLCEAQKQIDQSERKNEQDLKKEKDFRTKADREILAKIEAVETGGIYISAMGVVWLFVGVIMSTIPSELSKLID